MALMHSMQSGHTSAEAGLLRILRLLGEEAPQGEDWHYKLIERLSHAVAGDHARPALLSDSLTTDLHETRAFRHRVSHGYGDFNAARASPSIEAAGRLTTTLPEAIDVFKRLVDSD